MRNWIAAAAVIVMAAVAIAQRNPVARSRAATVAADAPAIPPTPAPHAVTAAAAPAADVNLLEAPAWRGTDPDGEIHLDSAGHVIPDLALRQRFDYLLSARGALDLAQIGQRLETTAQAQHLSRAQTAELRRLYETYIDYLGAMAGIKADSTDLPGLQRLYEQRHALRRDRLGFVAAEGYFGASEAEDRYVLAKLAITQDRTLSARQREQRLAVARALAPPALRDADDRADALATLSAGTERLRRDGGDAAQLQALRERTVGPEAAARLQAVDQDDAAWSQRVQAFEAARRGIESNAGLDAEDRRRQVEALIARDFSGPEIVRLRAVLGLDAASAPAATRTPVP